MTCNDMLHMIVIHKDEKGFIGNNFKVELLQVKI